jgi:5,6,7,8-tetrahydromethanopterin hydro-lyase
MTVDSTQVGEAFEGSGGNAAHINTVLGRKGTPFETAWVTALAQPRPGHIPFLVVLRPNLPVKPMTVFVNKAELRGDTHSNMTWGPAQAGVARGVAQAVADGVISEDEVEQLLLVAAVWVDWAADDATAVYDNNAAATRAALGAGRDGAPSIAEILAARDAPANPFFTPE